MAESKKSIFIETVERLFETNEVPQDAIDFFEDYKQTITSKKKFTDKGISIITEMREINDWITAKSLGERMDISGRSVSGTMRKLVTDGYIEKRAGNPICYKITDKGLTCDLEETE